MRSSEVSQVIKDTGITAILREISELESLKTSEALYKAGIKTIEVTFNTKGASDIILQLVKEYKEEMIIGAGGSLIKKSF